ncbi:MAG: hypothetical protein KatS3mg106_421 [Gemmataceae bacterium]|nr:MAG: hypothetical protein KatS3mg106_421 [Gemmataceae bacterium]
MTLAVYFNPDYGVTHTAIVRYVSPDQPVLVEGKWGNLGIYLHPVDSLPLRRQLQVLPHPPTPSSPNHCGAYSPPADGTSSPSPAAASSQPDADSPARLREHVRQLTGIGRHSVLNERCPLPSSASPSSLPLGKLPRRMTAKSCG